MMVFAPQAAILATLSSAKSLIVPSFTLQNTIKTNQA